MLAAAADLLDQGQLVNRLSVTLTAIAAAVLLLPVFPPSPLASATASLVLVCGLGELYLAVRAGFNAAIFRRLAGQAADDRLNVAAADSALHTLRLLPKRAAAQSMAQRLNGARRLLLVQAALLGFQIVLACGGGAMAYFGWA
jgi:hypothetical protein